MSKKGLYLFASIASVAGIAWLAFAAADPHASGSVCLFRNVTGIPCPSCGSTHAVLKLMHMDWMGALQDNPLGFVLAAALLVLPVWLLYDLVRKKSSFYHFYTLSEAFVRRRAVAIPLVALVLANWLWNIYKYV